MKKESLKTDLGQKTESETRREPVRLVALSDGLFATVLTLLVLDLRIPDALNSPTLTNAAFRQWIGPHLFSYLLTFLVAGTYWMAHHNLFDRIQAYDRGLLSYNLLFLLFIGLFPFSTATLGQLGVNTTAYPFYWAIYALNNLFAGIMLALLWNYAYNHRLVTPETTLEEYWHINFRQAVTPLVFLVSIGVGYGFRQVFLAPYTLLFIPLAILFVDRRFEKDRLDLRRSYWTRLAWRAGTILPWILVFGLAFWAMSR